MPATPRRSDDLTIRTAPFRRIRPSQAGAGRRPRPPATSRYRDTPRPCAARGREGPGLYADAMPTTRKREAAIAVATLGLLLNGALAGCSLSKDDEPDTSAA